MRRVSLALFLIYSPCYCYCDVASTRQHVDMNIAFAMSNIFRLLCFFLWRCYQVGYIGRDLNKSELAQR